MKGRHGFFVAGLVLLLASCGSPYMQITAVYDTFPVPNSEQIYEFKGMSSNATASCAGIFVDRWYGSTATRTEIDQVYTKHLAANGWTIWPEDVSQIWRKQEHRGLFSLSLSTFGEQDTVNPDRVYYQLPESIEAAALHYRTIWVVHVTYLDRLHAKHCFGK